MTVKAHISTEQGVSPTNLVSPELPQKYKPFLSYGYVYLPESNTDKPIMLLRDTGANQSLLLEGTLLLSGETSTGVTIFIQDVEVEPASILFHRVKLESDLVSGIVTVRIRPSLHVAEVDLILGNEMAGSEVTADPCVTSNPLYHDNGLWWST